MASPSPELDISSSVPLYRQIKNILRDEIFSGDLEPTVPVTEAQLLQRFGVSRAPIRQALGELAEEGYVYRRQGIGTFPIKEAHIERPADVRAGSLHRYLAKQGLNPTSTVSGVERVTAPANIRSRLGQGSSEELLHFHRLTSVDSTPLASTELYVVAPSAFQPTAEELESAGSVFDLLFDTHGTVLGRSDHEAWASEAHADVARHLKLPEKSAVLHIETVFFNDSAEPVGWRRAVHVADTFRYRFSETHR